ncbi:neprosin family prolyl endopeptidase [Streptomyces sp. RFCAC02]|uniref:neprosin family prolyl endopeptidase n=1 Tax=Streptomyces sp. RFCAC02 TaxID=2499143 RepID=UPI00101E9D5B|nr:neprosin family prolyl endopeptidase [Streptomyces sp. RFCAC02]
MPGEISPQPFDAFLASVASATYEEARHLPGAAVESADAFDEMKAYLLDRYRDVDAVDSYVEADGQVADCVPEETHPAARRWGSLAAAPAEGPPQVPEPDGPTPPDPRSRGIAGTRPPSGEAARPLPAGTTSLYRTTLSTLCRFPNLATFSAKDWPAGPPGFASTARMDNLPRRYATGEQDLDCLGGSSRVNVWSPFIVPTFQGTFSQQWYSAGHGGTLLQTVECGWHVDHTLYGDTAPHLFVFATRDNYEDGDSFYNLDHGVFQPVANPYVKPGAKLLASQSGGTQIEYKMGFYLTDQRWWFYFDDQPIGCIPVSWFNGGPLTNGATRAKFGGEAASGLALWPPMGSGQHASAGFGRAAYQRAVAVNPASGGAVYANLADSGSVTGSCYSIEITNNSSSYDWGTYAFFGGPGGTPC